MRLISSLSVAVLAMGCQPELATELDSALSAVEVKATVERAACETISFGNATPVTAGYFAPAFDSPFTGVTLSQEGSGGSSDFLGVELWYFGANSNPSLPMSVQLWATTRARCDVCVVLRRGCDASGSGCTRSFFANGGSVSFDSAARDSSSGRMSGSAPIVRLIEWDFAADQERAGGACVELTNVSFDATW